MLFMVKCIVLLRDNTRYRYNAARGRDYCSIFFSACHLARKNEERRIRSAACTCIFNFDIALSPYNKVAAFLYEWEKMRTRLSRARKNVGLCLRNYSYFVRKLRF